MDTRTGEVYDSRETALKAGVLPKDLVEITGHPRAVRKVIGRFKMASRSIEKKRKARLRLQKVSRKRNR